jgi:NAD(P)-dependent dehydrogenase (short-subunit alcohol dehydrogenase family)
MNRLLGKKALIFGDDPISIAIAARYAAEGASVTLLTEGGNGPAEQLENVTTAAISSANNDTDRAVIAGAAGASLDILVLGAADIPDEGNWVPLAQLSVGRLRELEDRLVVRALVALQACETALRAGGNSSVIFLYSPAGAFSEGGWADHTISYHARHGLMRAVAAEWGPVRANMLVPFADTPGFRNFRARNPEEVDVRVSVTGMKRVGDPMRDIGGAAVFLGSDDTQYVTGMMVHADGGAHLTIPTIETQMASLP